MTIRTHIALLAVGCLLLPGAGAAADWRPVDASEIGQKAPRLEPGADAEAIFWDVRVEDKTQGGDLSLVMTHYVRIKIFTELGREKYATVEIPRSGKQTVDEVGGRTIKQDGTIVELKKENIYDRQLVKTKGLKLHGKTFTLPNVAVGDIIEYCYREIRPNEISSHMRLYFQRELPMWSVAYHVKPLDIPWLPYGMRKMAFQCEHTPFKEEPLGFYGTSMSDVPAFKEEPNMPPEDQLRRWVLIYYEEDKKIDPEKYWKEIGKADFNEYKPRMKADNLVKQTAAELTDGAKTPEEKLAALDSFCRTKIRNLTSSAFRMTTEERKAVKDNRSPGSTLKQKAGTGTDVNLLFAALANASGFEARMARIADRGDTFFNKARPTTYFLRARSVAVRLSDKWVFFDPATAYLEPGMLRWQEEGTAALVSDPKEGFFVLTPFSEPSRSVRKRRATLKVLENGTLEGTVRYTYTGHVARVHKSRYEDMTPTQQEEDWKESLLARLSTAEISGFEIKDISHPQNPVVVQHKVTVPGYATRTGKRILLQPAFFQRNGLPRFTESKRTWDLYFHYGWAEDDEVTIELPEGWAFDQPVLPGSSGLGSVGDYQVEVRKTTDGRRVIYRRRFDWGRSNRLLIPAESYSAVKAAFDFVQEQDNYTLALKVAADAHK